MANYNNPRNLPAATPAPVPAVVEDTQLTAGNIFNSRTAFDLAVQMANTFAHSTIVPREYQNNAANCLIALNMATRIGTDPMMVMQNLNIIQGRPSWSSQFIIAMINRSGKYKTELQYELRGAGDSLECTAYTYDKSDRKVEGPPVTMQMAKAEGWLGRNGSKWQTMPETMIRYRAASFFGRLNCPELVMGIYSEDEVIEIAANEYKPVRPRETVVISAAPVALPPARAVYDGVMEVGELPMTEASGSPRWEPQSPPAAPKRSEHLVEPAARDGDGGAESVNNSAAGGSPVDFAPLTCADCGASISKNEQGFSTGKFGRPLCRACQNRAKSA